MTTTINKKNHQPNTKLPLGPTTSSWWNLLQWIIRPYQFMEECRAKYGETFTVNLRNFEPIVFLSNPQDIQQIITANFQQFDSGRANSIIQPLVGDNSLLLTDGTKHQRQRKLLTPAFHGQRMREYGELIVKITKKATENWQSGQQFKARDISQKITLQVILQAVFGLDEGENYQKLQPQLNDMTSLLNGPISSSFLFLSILQQDWGAWSPWGNFLRSRQRINDTLYAEITARRQNLDPHSTDILSLMLAARDEDGETMSDEELRDELITIVFAGYETTATMLAWMFYWIHLLPEVKSNLMEELQGLGDNPTPMEIVQLPYLNALCAETLRIYPAAPIALPRIPTSSIEIGGNVYEAGTCLFPCIYLVHHREELYPDSQQFKPERFLNHKFANYEYFPFGGGSRTCIGMAFAQFEMKLVIATILRHWQLELDEKYPVKPTRRGVTIAPKGGVKMKVKS